jgi:hypothetical protein
MKIFFSIKSCIGIAIALLILIVNISEISDFQSDRETYTKVYHIGSDGVKWKYQSDRNFIINDIIHIILCSIYIVGNILFLTKSKHNNVVKYLIIFVELIIIVFFIYLIFSWIVSGFDHP